MGSQLDQAVEIPIQSGGSLCGRLGLVEAGKPVAGPHEGIGTKGNNM